MRQFWYGLTNVALFVWTLIGVAAVQIAFSVVLILDTLLIATFDWVLPELIEKFLIGVFSVVFSSSLHFKFHEKKTRAVDKAFRACRFAIEEGRRAVKIMQEELNRRRGPEFFEAFKDARDALKFGRANFEKAKALVGKNFPESDATFNELQNIDEQRNRLLNDAIENNVLASIWDPRLLVQDQDEVSENTERHENSERRRPLAAHFEAVWLKEHPGRLRDRFWSRVRKYLRAISESLLAWAMNSVSRMLRGGQSNKNK